MPDRKKVKEYRATLHEMAKPQTDPRRKLLEGKAEDKAAARGRR